MIGKQFTLYLENRPGVLANVTRLLAQAKVNLDSMTYGRETNRATPKLTIEAGPRIEVNTVGAKISSKRLQRLVPIYEERAVDHDLLVEGARNLRNYFQADGYFGAEVEFKQQRGASCEC